MEVRGFVCPTWLAVTLGAMALCGSLALVIVLQLYRADVLQLTREIRLLELQVQSVENKMIQNGAATPQDFPSWEPGAALKRRKE